jgi:hypothetical protein
MIPSIKNSDSFKFDNSRYLSFINEETNEEIKKDLQDQYKKFISLVNTMDKSVDIMGEASVNFDYQNQLRKEIEKIRVSFENLITVSLQKRQQK